MDEFAGPGGLDPAHRSATVTIEVTQAAHPVALEDPVEGGRGHPGARGQASGSELVGPAQLDHSALHLGRGLGRTPSRSTRAVFESSRAGFEVATPPFVGGLARDTHRLSRAGDGPALFDHLAEPQSTLWGERNVTVHPEPPWPCGCVNSSTMPWRFTSSGDISRQQRPWVEQLARTAMASELH